MPYSLSACVRQKRENKDGGKGKDNNYDYFIVMQRKFLNKIIKPHLST